MIRMYIDDQKTRNQFRLRVARGRTEAVAIYFSTEAEAQKVKRMLRKVINVLEQGNNHHEQ